MRICMATDFFYPSIGGIETHTLSLSRALSRLGHKIVVITKSKRPREGVRYMAGGFKVYYIPSTLFYDQNVSSTLFTGSAVFIREILLRERIELVHGHQPTSVLSMETIFYAKLMGLKTVLTVHSTYDFGLISSVLYRKIAAQGFACVDKFISVSKACKENTIISWVKDYKSIWVIPNAIDSDMFYLNDRERHGHRRELVVLFICRLAAKKGVELLVEIIPEICKKFEHVNFSVVGDGPMKKDLYHMIKIHNLYKRVKIKGAVKYDAVPKILRKGHIFLSTSFDESFGIRLLEALSTGLSVVSTNVGGLTEILPQTISHFKRCEPKVDLLIKNLEEAIKSFDLSNERGLPKDILKTYSWSSVANRTLKIYESGFYNRPSGPLGVIKRVVEGQSEFSYINMLMLCLSVLYYLCLDWFLPKQNTEIALDFECKESHKSHK